MFEETFGDWMIEAEKDFRVENRIACEERGYPLSEALYSSVEDWEKTNGRNWINYVAEMM